MTAVLPQDVAISANPDITLTTLTEFVFLVKKAVLSAQPSTNALGVTRRCTSYNHRPTINASVTTLEATTISVQPTHGTAVAY